MTESQITISSANNLIVNTNPTIQFDNGMVLWLGNEGESVEVSTYDWQMILAARPYINQIGLIKDRYVDNPKVLKPIVKKSSIFTFLKKFLFNLNK